MDLMMARLNALLVSQSFLIIAYATSMTISNGQWGHFISLLLPPFLALLGLALAWEARNGIFAARSAVWRWRKRLNLLVSQNPELDSWAENSCSQVLETQRAGELFAVRPPIIFIVGWVWLLSLPFILKFFLISGQ
jgi:hypothetical protein